MVIFAVHLSMAVKPALLRSGRSARLAHRKSGRQGQMTVPQQVARRAKGAKLSGAWDKISSIVYWRKLPYEYGGLVRFAPYL